MRSSEPPKIFHRFFRWYCHPKLKNAIEGDLIELYNERRQVIGKSQADRKFIVDVLLLFRPSIIRPAEGFQHINQYGMFKNYFKVGLRNILKYKMFSFINIFGLAIAMSVCMLIMLMLADQNRYDAFHEKKDRIYRILSNAEGAKQFYATTPFPLASTLKADYPIIEEAVNIMPAIGGDGTYQQQIADMRGYFADPSFFRVFGFELKEGDKNSALVEPNSMIISQDIAYKLFNAEDPVGKTIEFSDRQLPFPQRHDGIGSSAVSWGNFTVTGVIDESKYKSHLTFDVLVSSSSRATLIAEKKLEDLAGNWEWFYRAYTYVLIPSEKNESDLTTALNDLVVRKYADNRAEQTKGFQLIPQKLSDVQLGLSGNDTDNRMPQLGYYFLAGLALVVMVTACLNYTNLSVARALTRAKEIGVRKVTGANKLALVFQFLSESVITSLLALAMACIMLYFIADAFKKLWVNQYLNFELPSSISIYMLFAGFAILIGLIAGLYPALHLSTYQPIKALKNLDAAGPGKMGMRKVVTVSQFVISLLFITTSILVFNQFKHFMEFDYGFTSKNIVNIELQGMNYQKLANELSSVPAVSTISATDIIPATGRSNGTQLKKAGTTEKFTEAYIIISDENFTKNLDLTMVAGRQLPSSSQSSDKAIVINEQAVKKLGFATPSESIGQIVETKWGSEQLEIVGVVKDFRYNLLINSDKINPLILRNQPDRFQYLNVKVSSNDLMAAIAQLETKWKKLDPTHPFKYEFYDQQLAATHQGIFDLVSILGFIALLAIVIACLGLLGMATYTSERRTKEVGIRKVMGAEGFSIALLLSKEFLKMLALAILIGAPISYLINNFWLQYFPNRVSFGVGTILIGVLVLTTLGILTIGSQTLRITKRNPIDSLRMD